MMQHTNLELICMIYCFAIGFHAMTFRKYPVTMFIGPIFVFYFIFFNPILGAAIVTVAFVSQLISGEFFST